MEPLKGALAAYVAAYHAGDVDGLVSTFAQRGEVSFGRGEYFRGRDELRRVHERVGTFRFEIDRVLTPDDANQVVEGRMLALRDAAPVADADVPFVAVADFVDSACSHLRSLRFYYDGGRIAQAVAAAGLDSAK